MYDQPNFASTTFPLTFAMSSTAITSPHVAVDSSPNSHAQRMSSSFVRRAARKHFKGYKGGLRTPLPVLDESDNQSFGLSPDLRSGRKTNSTKPLHGNCDGRSKWVAPACSAGNVNRPLRKVSLRASACKKLAEQLAKTNFEQVQNDDTKTTEKQEDHTR